MQDEIEKVRIDQGKNFSDEELEEAKKYGKEIDEEELDQDELDRLQKEAEERIKSRPLIWRPKEGEKRLVEVLGKEKKPTEFGEADFFELKDLRTGQLLSLLAHGVLLKHLQVNQSYLLIYQGKQGDYHSWIWEELKK